MALRDLQRVWSDKLPEDSTELFAKLLAKPQDELVRLLAISVAVNGGRGDAPRHAAPTRARNWRRLSGLDMAAWWQPTTEGYFKHVSEAAILEAVGEYAPEHVTRLAKSKKADIASEAERLADGTGWHACLHQGRRHRRHHGAGCAAGGDERRAGSHRRTTTSSRPTHSPPDLHHHQSAPVSAGALRCSMSTSARPFRPGADGRNPGAAVAAPSFQAQSQNAPSPPSADGEGASHK